jgi:GNAT superfamily N-acetyltransferase
MGDFDNEVKIIHDLYSRGWEHNWGEVPLTPEEFDYMAKDLKPVVDPRLIIIVELKGKPIGFALSLPNLNEILIHNRKGLLLPALARLLLFRKRVRSVRIIILGVLPEYQGTGAGAVLFYETSRRATENGYPHGEASWVLEDNVMMNRAAEFLNGTRTKTYRLYQLDFVKQ